MIWFCKTFEELSKEELYQILYLRQTVFTIEQRCIWHDLDQKDQKSHHIAAFNSDLALACTRIVPKSLSFPEVSIGRVATHSNHRKEGLGRKLMEFSIEKTIELYGKTPIRIGAQYYLKKFYESFGFVQVSAIYDEDGIDHIEMLLG